MLVSCHDPAQKSSTFFARLKSAAAISCLLAGTAPSFAQVQQTLPAPAPGLPVAPAPNPTQPLFMRDTSQDYSKARGYWPNPLAPYSSMTVPAPSFGNSLQLDDLVKNGKIYLSLGDAVLLALQDNYDIAIQRLNLDIADTDLLRARAGGAESILGIPTSLVTGTQGGTTATVNSVGGGPGGSSSGASVAGTGPGGLSLSTSGLGPIPATMDPAVQGTLEWNHLIQPQQTPFGGAAFITQNTDTYNFTYNQGFITGTNLQLAFQNNRVTTNNLFSFFSPSLQSTFNFSLTQHLLQGFGTGVNGRFIVQAKNDRRIADSLFRQQLLYTINQVENIYWGLVSAYEDVQSKQRALDQSTALEKDDEKQLQIGSMAPLDVVNARSQMSSDQQSLIASQNTLEYQQLIMKQAISRNLDDPRLANAPIIPTDRVSLAETPEEHMSVDDLVREADANRPDVEQAMLNLKIDKLTLKGVKNGLLPVLDLQAFYGATGLGGAVSPNCATAIAEFGGNPSECTTEFHTTGYGTVFGNLFNSTAPNKGVEVTMNIPIRNRTAQATEERSQIEYRKAQMVLQQLYIQIRMNVISQQYAITNDRAAVNSAVSNHDFNQQSLDAELKKLHLGASTTANVLQQQRNLAAADAQLIAARARYATDRAALEETLASTLDRYGISIVDAATGQVHTKPVIPGLEPAAALPEVQQPTQQQELQQQEQQQQTPPQPPPAQPQSAPQP